MTIDLSNYTSIQTNLFVRIDVPGYEVLRFSDYHRSFEINSEIYGSLGSLMAITDSSSELRATAQEITITISGIPVNRIQEILAAKIKGSHVMVHRAFFNVTTGAFLNITGNPAGKFQGIVSNFSILDDAGDLRSGAPGTITLAITCTSVVEMMENKVSGRKTNPIDQRALYPNDASFDRVPNLARANFNFGAPK